MIVQNNYEDQFENRSNTMEEIVTSNIAYKSTQVNSSQVDVYTLERSIFGKVRSEVAAVMTTL